jgi:hypothetical protein
MTVARAQVGSNGNREAEIVKRLLDLWEQIPSDERETLLIPGLEPEARELVRTNPFAFLLAASLDRGTKTEIIWTLPWTACSRRCGIWQNTTTIIANR